MCKIEDVKREERQCCFCKIVFSVCFTVSVCLIIGGFLTPPMGVIDGSVLTAVGELLLFPTLVYGFRALELGLDIKFTKGDASVEIQKDME